MQQKNLMMFALTVTVAMVVASTPAHANNALDLDADVVVQEDPQPERLRISLEDYQDLYAQSSGLAPDPTAFDGIRPGQLILVTVPNEGTFICTLSFIFEDLNSSSPKYYAGTAGHCLLPSTAVSTHGPGANYNPNNVAVQVCVSFCVFGGQLSGFLATMAPLGDVVYARQSHPNAHPLCPAGDIGNDFGLIEIHANWYNLLNEVYSSMAVWDGPHGSNSFEGTGALLGFHGNGIVAGTSESSKARTMLSVNDGIVCSWSAAGGPVHGGDSGSAIGRLGVHGTSAPHGTEALGTVTHGLIGAGAVAFGTTIDRGIQLARDDANIHVDLVDSQPTPL